MLKNSKDQVSKLEQELCFGKLSDPNWKLELNIQSEGSSVVCLMKVSSLNEKTLNEGIKVSSVFPSDLS